LTIKKLAQHPGAKAVTALYLFRLVSRTVDIVTAALADGAETVSLIKMLNALVVGLFCDLLVV
jgi:uncharacterized membrane protein YczE